LKLLIFRVLIHNYLKNCIKKIKIQLASISREGNSGAAGGVLGLKRTAMFDNGNETMDASGYY